MVTVDQITLKLNEKINPVEFAEAVQRGERLGYLQLIARDIMSLFSVPQASSGLMRRGERTHPVPEEQPVVRNVPAPETPRRETITSRPTRPAVEDGVSISNL